MPTNTPLNTSKQVDEILDQAISIFMASFQEGKEGGVKAMAEIEQMKKAEVKQALAEWINTEIIGDDEPVTTKIGKGSISRGTVAFTNRLRAEQRKKLSNLINGEEKR